MKRILSFVLVSLMIVASAFYTCIAQESHKKPDYSTIGFELMQQELDSLNKNVLNTLGKPDSKTEPTYWGADGLTHQQWKFKDKGISVDIVGENNNLSINYITIKNPDSIKTQKNIGVGSSAQEVFEAYKGMLNPEESDLAKLKNNDSSKYTVTAGTCYGGIMFTIDNNKVVEIFIGAGAE